MHSDQARVARALERHPDLMATPDERCLVRRGQLVVGARDVAAVESSAARWIDRRDDDEGASVALLRLRPGVDAVDLAATTAAPAGHRALSVSPNHVLRGQPVYSGGPADVPKPSAPLPVPPAAPGPTAAGPRLAVLDTGLARHDWFAPGTFDAVTEELDEQLDADGDYRLDTQAGHGTFVAGIVRQRLPEVQLYVGRVLDSDGFCDELALVTALGTLWRRTNGAGRPIDVLNLSLGGYTYDDRPSPVLADALARFGRRTAVVAAAGNNGSDRPFWPAALKNVVAVGAVDAAGERAAYSNYGWWVDASAEGTDVRSTFVVHDGPVPDTAGVDADCFRGYASWSGTSFAAPQVSAWLAGAMADRGLPASAAVDELLDPVHGDPVADLGVRLGRAPVSPDLDGPRVGSDPAGRA